MIGMEVRDGYYIVEFLEDVLEFIGSDLREYGPFEKGDRA